MRDVSVSNITEAVIATFADDTAPRTRVVLEALVRHLHAFARDVELTQREWHEAVEFLRRAGEKSDETRNEFILASDVLGLTSLIDIINNRNAGDAVTESSVLGPFYVEGAPVAPGGQIPGPRSGRPLVVTGQVLSSAGHALPGAVLDVWLTGENGLYDVQDPEVPDGSYRGKVEAGEDGRYRFVTVRPAPYTVPTDGPVGELLGATGRHPWRPAHLHLIVSATGHSALVTELFVADDPYIDEDAVFGVRDSIAVEFEDVDAAEEARAAGIDGPFTRVRFDFRLRPAA